MKRSTFVIFGIVVLLLGVGIPAWALTKEGSEDSSAENVASGLQEGKDLFVINCGACHTLAAAGTDGQVGPNLDELLAGGPKSASAVKGNQARVLQAVQDGIAGRMPKGILQAAQAKLVAQFVADNVAYIQP